MGNLENHQKRVPCMEKSWNLKKTQLAWKNHGILWNNLTKPPAASKLPVKHTKLISQCRHGLQSCFFKYITVAAFHIYAQHVKMPLKGEVGGHALYCHRNYIVDHGKIMEWCFWISVGTLILCFDSSPYDLTMVIKLRNYPNMSVF